MTKGERIHKLRLAKGLTMEELGKKVGVSKPTIKRYESGIIDNIPSDKIEAISNALETTPAYIMGWEERPELMQSAHTRAGAIKPNQARLFEIIERSNDQQQDKILKLIGAVYPDLLDENDQI
ncbi:MAG: helix-turn-helix transcriptional regulator [Clostridia bacterium]|nr:helix-turn-helix transcriptional regulator [Clostridia bacterium]